MPGTEGQASDSELVRAAERVRRLYRRYQGASDERARRCADVSKTKSQTPRA